MKEVRDFAEKNKIKDGIAPGKVLQLADVGGYHVWKRWQEGGSCTLPTAEKLRRFMRDNATPSVQTETVD